ncbi:hypothetical protein SAMN04487943_11930 [Gracilibacillus orientalis]|uniref:Uncharacterized protein n=1 Tax=Gracilibacillus orientalis TaxID=334253 RepID=A0A1I4QZD9_9BACI|nr:hypothetical protein [Gracilibacillus orientalis]SFM45361.1 hypothetical protein SAMN04487943_11930 [Gracilibacillus orientalis]
MAKILVPLYVFFLGASLAKEAISYFNEASYWFALLGGLLGVLLIVSLVGFFTNKKSLLWLTIISVSLFSLYLIGANIYIFFTDFTAVLFPLFISIILLPIHFYIIQYTHRILY